MSVMELTHRRRRGQPGMGYAAVGSYNPTPVYGVLSNQANVVSSTYNPDIVGSGGYEPMQTLASYLRTNVLKPALGGSDALQGRYLDAATMQSQLSQAAQSYCVGGEFGGPNDPCAGNDNGTAAQAAVINSLVTEYVNQVNAQGGASGLINPSNALGYQYTAYTPSYSETSGIISYGNNGSGGIITNPGASLSLPVVASPNSQYTQESIATGGQPLPGYTPPASSPGGTASFFGTQGAAGTNPSPSLPSISSILGGSSPSNPGATSIINGTPVNSTTGSQNTAAATAPSWFTDPNQEVITGLPNWGLVAGGGGGLLVLLMMLK